MSDSGVLPRFSKKASLLVGMAGLAVNSLTDYGSTAVYRSLQKFLLRSVKSGGFSIWCSVPVQHRIQEFHSWPEVSVVGNMWSPLYTEIPSFTEAYRNTESFLGREWRP